MATFMDKLKGRGLTEKGGSLSAGSAADHAGTPAMGHQEVVPSRALQLPVDVFQSDDEIIIYAQLAGMDMHTLDVSIAGDNDVVAIQGTSLRPEHLMHDAHAGRNGDYTLEECHWGDFYRQIILPDEIDPERAEAKTKDGVLALRLPLAGKAVKGRKLNIVRADEQPQQ